MYAWRRAIRAALLMLAVCLPGLALLAAQAAPEPKPQMSENVFTNIQALKGIPVDEFMDVMGMFSASLGYDCVSCHSPNISTDRAAFAVVTPQIQRARQMVVMMNAINRSYFRGERRVTCFTCHRGHYRPEVVPSLALQYGELIEDPSAMRILPDGRTSVDQVFQRYLQALGGARQVAAIRNYVARGTYTGFNTGGNEFSIEIAASAPDRRAQVVRTPEGDAVKTYDGRTAWAAEGWRPLPLLMLTGGNREAARLEAMASFPATIRPAFSQWLATGTEIDGRPVHLLQGMHAGQLPVNFYFDESSGLLVRMVRWNRTVVGIVPSQVDYDDYRDVAGVKMPFRIVVTWTDGQNAIVLKEVQPNVLIDPARFNRPAPFRK